MNAQIKNALWQSATIVNDYRYTPALWRADPVGRLIYLFAFRDRSHPNGWDIGHIVSKADGGTDDLDNLQVEHFQTTSEKEAARALFKNKRRYDPLLSVYGYGQRIQPFIGSIG